MSALITTDQVWVAIEKEVFAVMGMVTKACQARTVGIVYVVRNRKLYIVTEIDTWKINHIQENPNVSITIPIAKRIPFMPWFKIPAATITFSGTALLLDRVQAPEGILETVMRGMEVDPQSIEKCCVIEITPRKDFLTYGIGVSLMDMRDPNKATGRVPVA